MKVRFSILILASVSQNLKVSGLYFPLFQMVAFQIFGFSIYWYGIFYALAFILGYFGFTWMGKQQWFSAYPRIQKLLTEELEDLLFAIALGVIFGGRLGHVLIYGNGYYFSHLSEIFKVREGGMSFIWGILGVVVAIACFVKIKKLTQQDFLFLFDLILIFVPLGIFFGRFGNYLNQELYGIPLTQLPNRLSQTFNTLGLVHQYDKVDQLLRVNTNFLSMIFEGLWLFLAQILVAFRMVKQKKRKIWLLATNFLLFYSIIRFVLEYLRADSQMEIVGFLSKSQRFFLIFIVIALIIKYLLIKKNILLKLTDERCSK